MKTLFKFYLKNFRAIHHIIFIIMVFGSLKLSSFVYTPFKSIFSFDSLGILMQLTLLAICFYFGQKSLRSAGLTDEYMKEQLKKLN